MTETLQILYGDTAVGTLAYDRRKDAITLTYDEAWRFSKNSFPASLSLPLARGVHADDSIRPFLQGLLPDNPAVLDAWGKRFQVSPRNPFDLIKHVGEDCAGALQFVRPDRLEQILSGELDSLVPLSDKDLAKRIEDLTAQSHSIPVNIQGRFSLAGAQTKDALHLKDGKWFIPSGRIPSTHILKPQPEGWENLALNEHFCLKLASRIGLIRVESCVLQIANQNVLCVKRYDRLGEGGNLTRIHQEDTCQALGFGPDRKYQNDGGPSAADIVRLLDRFSNDSFDDVTRFLMALAFNWVIAGTDAHSKNYSLLHWKGSMLRLAPLYDLISNLPYQRDPKSKDNKLAMKIGGTYKLREINSERWNKWLAEAGLSTDWTYAAIRLVVEMVQEHADETRSLLGSDRDHPFVIDLVGRILENARRCAEALQ